MFSRSTILTLLATVLLLATLAGPATAAKKDSISQAGHGTWTHIEAGVAFTGTTTGLPFDGVTTGEVSADDGTLPPWPGCEEGSGTLTTVDGKKLLTLRVWGNLCRAVSPAGYLVFRGWYEVIEYSGAKGRRVADGVGGLGMEFLADGSAQWMPMGDLY